MGPFNISHPGALLSRVKSSGVRQSNITKAPMGVKGLNVKNYHFLSLKKFCSIDILENKEFTCANFNFSPIFFNLLLPWQRFSDGK